MLLLFDEAFFVIHIGLQEWDGDWGWRRHSGKQFSFFALDPKLFSPSCVCRKSCVQCSTLPFATSHWTLVDPGQTRAQRVSTTGWPLDFCTSGTTWTFSLVKGDQHFVLFASCVQIFAQKTMYVKMFFPRCPLCFFGAAALCRL